MTEEKTVDKVIPWLLVVFVSYVVFMILAGASGLFFFEAKIKYEQTKIRIEKLRYEKHKVSND